MRFADITKAAGVAVVATALAVPLAGAASAHTVKPVTAVTQVSGRADSGGAGNTWAIDRFTRTVNVWYLGKSHDPAHAAAPYMYWAQTADKGTFTDLPGQLTPNQGGRYAGKVLGLRQVSGPMTGTATWGVFYASARARNGLAPQRVSGSANAAYPTSTWPELAFPAGTTFTGVALSDWSWTYAVSANKTLHVRAQQWVDGQDTGAGQLPGDGNITGR